MKTLDLNGTWQFRAVNRYGALPSDKSNLLKWMRATVPGTIHTDLMASKQIPDPFFRMNENDVQWIDSQQWQYRREFTIPKNFFDEKKIELSAEGLDTYATIIINGKVIGKTSNMFIGHTFDVKKYLNVGKNILEVLFDSPVRRSTDLEKKHRIFSLED